MTQGTDYFDVAFRLVMAHEGGYVNNPKDPGGATKYGISLRFFKQFTGRALPDTDIVGDLDGDGDIDADDIKLISVGLAHQVYRRAWWDKHHYKQIQHRDVAIKLIDFAVNMGQRRAVVNLQRSLRASTGRRLVEDGVMGQKTLAAINGGDEATVTCGLMCETAGFYRRLGEEAFLSGWLNRAYSREYLDSLA